MQTGFDLTIATCDCAIRLVWPRPHSQQKSTIVRLHNRPSYRLNTAHRLMTISRRHENSWPSHEFCDHPDRPEPFASACVRARKIGVQLHQSCGAISRPYTVQSRPWNDERLTSLGFFQWRMR